MYPTDKCHLCNDKLYENLDKSNYYCKRDHYYVWSDGTISIYINGVLFEFYPDDEGQEIKTQIFLPPINEATYRLPEWVYVTPGNYLSVLNRFKKLEIFK